MAFQHFEPIFAEPKLELKPHTSSPLRPFLFHAYAPDSSHLLIHVTDFHTDTWEAHLSISLLEDIVSIFNHHFFIYLVILCQSLIFIQIQCILYN